MPEEEGVCLRARTLSILRGSSARALLGSGCKLILINEKSTRRGPETDFNLQKNQIVVRTRAEKFGRSG